MPEYYEWGLSIAYIITGMMVMLIAKLIQDVLTPYKMNEHLTGKDNPALGLSVAGYLIGSVIIFLGASSSDSTPVETLADAGIQLGIVAAYALGGIACLNIGRVLIDKVMLPKFHSGKEIIEDRNLGMGAVEFSGYIGTALVIGASVSGDGGGPLTALACFAIGQLGLIIFVKAYEVAAPFNVQEELEKDNISAGVVLGGGLIAISILMAIACYGDWYGWAYLFERFATLSLAGFAALLVVRWFVDRAILPHSSLKQEIAIDQNLAAAFLESGVCVIMSALIAYMLL